jgi:hypothetical protein
MPVSVPDYVSQAASRGLEWHKDGKSGDGVTDQTLAEARDMVRGSVSEDKVRRMGPWFRRHRADMDAPKNNPDNEDFPGAGAVAWALWGGPTSGDIMRTAEWAEAKVEQLDREESAKSPSSYSKPSIIKMTIEDQLSTAELLAQALTSERDDLRATVEKLTVGAADELTAIKADLVTKEAALADLGVSLEKANAERDAFAAKIAELEATKVSASKEAAKIAASVGVEPTAIIPGSDNAAAKVDVLATYNSLTDPKAKADFFAKNAQAIYASIKV